MNEMLGGPPAASPLPVSRPTGYIPTLEAWRAIAILAVLMEHDAPWTFHSYTNAAWHEDGGWSVFLLFVISRFLVCGRTLAGEQKYGGLRLKAFYIRRICRIQPPALAYLALIALLVAIGISHEQWSKIGSALVGTQNLLYRSTDNFDPTGNWWLTRGTIYFYALNFWLLAAAYHPESWTTRSLEWRPLRFIGGISYVLYLWHLPFFIRRDPRVDLQSSRLRVLTERPLRYAAAFDMAILSTYTLELFFRRLGHSVATPATPGDSDLEMSPANSAEPTEEFIAT